jgi:hypothetical protein
VLFQEASDFMIPKLFLSELLCWVDGLFPVLLYLHHHFLGRSSQVALRLWRLRVPVLRLGASHDSLHELIPHQRIRGIERGVDVVVE